MKHTKTGIIDVELWVKYFKDHKFKKNLKNVIGKDGNRITTIEAWKRSATEISFLITHSSARTSAISEVLVLTIGEIDTILALVGSKRVTDLNAESVEWESSNIINFPTI